MRNSFVGLRVIGPALWCAFLATAAIIDAPIVSAAPAVAANTPVEPTTVTPLNKNLLANAGAERGGASSDGNTKVPIPGWHSTGNFTVVRYGTVGGFPGTDASTDIAGGHKFFSAGPESGSTCGYGYQSVTLAGRRAAIDSGRLRARLSAQLATFDDQVDDATVLLLFIDTNGHPIRREQSQLVSRTSDTFVSVSASAELPVGTTSIRVTLLERHHQGSYCDGYFDNVSLVLSATPAATSVATGGEHTCAVRSDHTAWCWGSDFYGQLGDGTTGGSTSSRTRPVEVSRANGSLIGVTQISAGHTHSCARTSDGAAWCWGDDVDGQLGDGTVGDASHLRLRPVRVRQGPGFLRGVTKVRAGDRFSCALDRDGHVWCWGFAGAGQLGDGTYGNAHLVRLRPVRVLGSNGPLGGVTDIDLGDDFACALRTDRSVWCWGGDYFGQLGDGSRGGIDHARKRAVPVHQGSGLLSSATQISVGADHACALKGNRTAVCWGDATSGQIGDGSTGGSSGIRWSAVPVKIGSGVFASLTAVSAGSFFSCAVKQSGSTWCWGDDSVGELGDGTKGDAQHLRLSPVRVLTSTSATLDRVTRVSAGGGHACALRSFGDPDGTVWCWGQDSSGQVGDGTTGDTDQLRLAAVQTDFR